MEFGDWLIVAMLQIQHDHPMAMAILPKEMVFHGYPEP
jgi:hypothetical protein